MPLTRTAATAIEAYLLKGRPRLVRPGRTALLFVGSRATALSGRPGRARAALGKKSRHPKHVTCHTFRHRVATHLLKGRADIRHIQALLGHSSLSTTERYTRVEISDLQEVLARAHPRGR